MLKRELRILHLEDNELDAAAVLVTLKQGGFPFVLRRVEDREGFLRELMSFRPDLILADYLLPSFTGLEALDLAKKTAPEVPCLFFTGSMGEEQAVGALKAGATDYLLKSSLPRLLPAVLRALKEAEGRAERIRLQAEFLQAQKMEAMGRLAGGIAHDFNNLLTAILGYCDLILPQLPADAPVRRQVEEVRRAGQRAAELTRKILAFTRRQVVEPRVLDLNSLVRDLEDLLRRVIGEDVELALTLAPDLRRIKADPSHLEQVIMNLVVNARDAMPDGGKLTIETTNLQVDETKAGRHERVRAGSFVALGVRDTGCGMDEDILSRLFEPFFTTKEAGKGTGLGLAMVYGTVTQAGGFIEVESLPGQGTLFRICLPRAEGETQRIAPPPARPAERGSETVLLAEDEALVRALLTEILESGGYTVLAACDGVEALDIAAKHGGRIALLVTDMVMPGPGGGELASAVAGLHPGIRVLYVSGYASTLELQEVMRSQGAEFLQKPFSLDLFLRKVRDVLDPKT